MLNSAAKRIVEDLKGKGYGKVEAFEVEENEGIQSTNCCRRRPLFFKTLWLVIGCVALFAIVVILMVGVHYMTKDYSIEDEETVEGNVCNTGGCNNSNYSHVMDYPIEDEETVEENACNTRGCNYSAKFVQQSLDIDVDPCDDFFKFSCGKWIGQHPAVNKHDLLEELEDQLLINLKRRIEGPPGPEDKEAIRDMMNVYRVCMNSDDVDDREYLGQMINDFGGWPLVTKGWKEQNFSLELVLAKLARESRFFFFRLKNRFSDGFEIFQILVQNNISDFYAESSIRNAIEIVANGVDIDENELLKLVQFAKELNTIIESFDYVEDCYYYYSQCQELSIRDLRTSANYPFAWCTFLNAALQHVRNFSQGDTFLVSGFEQINQIIELTHEAGMRTTMNFLMWKYVDSYMAHFRNSSSKQSGKEPRWKYCLKLFDDVSDYTTGNTYAKYFEAVEKKSSVDEIVEDLMVSLRNILKITTWMDKKASVLWQEKAAAIHRTYPSDELDIDGLSKFHLEFEPSAIHFENIRNIDINLARLRFNSAPFFIDTLWGSWSLLDFLNAYYDPYDNKIEIEDGELQPPFFSADNINLTEVDLEQSLQDSRVMNYGALGSVIGHELTHAFDATGMQVDGNGDYISWPINLETDYEERTNCIKNQYDKYCFGENFDCPPCRGLNEGTSAKINHTINGTLTLNENIADIGGMQLAIEAYAEWRKRNGTTDDRLPGLPQFTPHQLFFISYAQTWCQYYTRNSNISDVNTLFDVHSPVQFRVLGTLSNSEEFAKAFNCTVGSKMNPASKCKFW